LRNARQDIIGVIGTGVVAAIAESSIANSGRLFHLLSWPNLELAKAELAEKQPDIVLVDCALFDLAAGSFEDFRDLFPFLPIVVIGTRYLDAIAFTHAGADDFLLVSEFTGVDLPRLVACTVQKALARLESTVVIGSLRRGLENRKTFLAQISHEMRNPLNGILGMLSVLESSALSVDQKQMVQAMKSSGESLRTLLSDLLEISKIAAGKVKISVERIEIRQLVEACLQTFAGMAAQKQLFISSIVSNVVPKYVEGDPFRIKQLINNLLSNAIKYTDKGFVVVRLDL
jgi:signal transduction histidine kinase